jgi:LPXTG-motif cell wall-anchored protein
MHREWSVFLSVFHLPKGMIMKFRRLAAVSGVVVSLFAALLIWPSLASAHNTFVNGTAACQSDGTYTITWHVENDWDTIESATLVSNTGGGTLTGIATSPGTDVPVKSGSNGFIVVTQTGVSGTATTANLSIKGVWPDDTVKYANYDVPMNGKCTTVTPAAPTLVQSHCTDPGKFTPASYTIIATPHVTYFANGVEVGAGTYNGPFPTGVTITAQAVSPFTLTGTTSWPLAAFDSSKCIDKVTPVAPSITQGACTGPGTFTKASYTINPTDGVTYLANGSIVTGGPHNGPFPGAVVITVQIADGYVLMDGATVSWQVNAFDSSTCTPIVTPKEPSITQSVCNGPGTHTVASYTINATAGVTYLANGTPVTGGPHNGPFPVVITVQIADGYVLKDGATVTWTIPAFTDACLLQAVPVAPGFHDATCVNHVGTDTTLTLTETPHVKYYINDSQTPATYEALSQAPGSTIKITAVADSGYTITGTSVWNHTFGTALDCSQHMTPATPKFIASTCTGPGVSTPATYTILTTTGVQYFVNGSETPAKADTYQLAAGQSVTVVAKSLPTYAIDGQNTWTYTATQTDCTSSATPVVPTFTPEQCSTGGTHTNSTVTIPATAGVTYFVDGVLTPPSTITVGSGTHVVTAAPTAGYYLAGYPAGGWSYTVASVACLVPSVVTSVLASTGSDSAPFLLIGLSMLLLGMVLVLATRRRRPAGTPAGTPTVTTWKPERFNR